MSFTRKLLWMLLATAVIVPRAGWCGPIEQAMARASFSAGAEYAFYRPELDQKLGRTQEWQARVAAGIGIIPHLGAIVSSRYGLDAHEFAHRAGIRATYGEGIGEGEVLPLLNAKRVSVGAGLDYAWYQGELGTQMTVSKQWEGAAALAYSLVPSLALTGSATYGLVTHDPEVRVGLSLHLWSGL